jgi:hypothetical protein
MNRPARFSASVWHVALALPIFAVGFVRHLPIKDNSFLWHVTAGRLQLEQGAVLTSDPFSFTMLGEPWRTQSWLADIGYAVADARWGLNYVPWMVWLLSAALLAGVLLVAFRASRSLVATAVFGVLTTIVSIAFLNPRPVIFSYLLFVLLVLAEQDRRLRWTLPLVIWLWASLHGSFVIGAAYLVLQVIRRRRWEAWKEIAAAGFAALLTAHGLGVVEMLSAFGGSRAALDLITEWAPPDLLTFPMAPLFLAIPILIWGAMRGSIGRRDLIVVIPFLALAFSANRSVLPAWIALSPFLAASLQGIEGSKKPVPVAVSRVNLALIVLLIAGPLIVPAGVELDASRFPLEAAQKLESERVFHDDSTGGFLIYSQWPGRLVYVDDRAELYGAMFEEFALVRAGRPGWDEVLDVNGMDEILLPVGQPLLETVRLAGWVEAHRDEVFAVMRRP